MALKAVNLVVFHTWTLGLASIYLNISELIRLTDGPYATGVQLVTIAGRILVRHMELKVAVKSKPGQRKRIASVLG